MNPRERGKRVLVADDHPVVREGLRRLLLELAEVGSVEEAGDGIAVLQALRDRRFDLLLLDLSLPGKDGLEVLGEASRVPGAPPVLVISMHSETVYVLRSLQKGAAGYLPKDSSPDQLKAAVRKVLGGGRFLTPQIAEALAFRAGEGSGKAPHELLSPREFQVLRLMASGRTVKEIGVLLHLSEKTVSTYRTRILEKTGFRNNAELVRYALENHLLD